MICKALFRYKKIFSYLILSLLTPSAFAAIGQGYLGAMLGVDLTYVGNTNPKITYDTGAISDAYPIGNNLATPPIVGLFGGYEFLGCGAKPAVAIGLGIYSTTGNLLWNNFQGKVKETITGLPTATLYKYNFDVRSQRVMAETQFSWLIDHVSPFINAGVGTAWNRLSSYSESVIGSGFVALPPFESRTSAHFAYQAGVGISYVFNLLCDKNDFWHERVSLGYRFVDTGKASFGTRGPDYPYTLNMGILRSNEIYLSYTTLF